MNNLKSKKIDLTVVIPCFNEEKNISIVIEKTSSSLKKAGISYELIVVDDGSTDDTSKIVEAIDRNKIDINLIKHKENKGFGSAFWTGVDSALGKSIILIPGDNENDILEIAEILNLMDHVDIIIPYVINKKERPLIRRALSFAYNKIINFFFIMSLNYTNGTVVYNAVLLKKLRSDSRSFFFQTEILIRSIKSGYIFAEVPVKINTTDKSNMSALTIKQFTLLGLDFLKTFYLCMFTKKKLIALDENSISYKRKHKI